MVRVRLRDDGPAQYQNRSGVYADEDDPVVDVDDEHAAYLVDDTGYFEFVDPDPRLDAADDEENDSDDSDDSDDDAGTCDEVKADGEVCGRELPCPYHTDDAEADEED